MPAMRLSEACLEAPDVGALVRGFHLCRGGCTGGGQVGVPKRRPDLQGPKIYGMARACRVEECTEWVGCSFLPAGSGVEPAAGAPQVVCNLLWCHLCPRFRRRAAARGGWELLVREEETKVVEVKCEKDVAGRNVQAAPAVA